MAAESIGVIYSTKVPGYADNADIQAAFKLYHYGSTDYNTANSNVANLVNPSIAYSLNDLQDQIDGLDPAGSVSLSTITAKGDILVGQSNGVIDNLAIGSDNYILTADSTQTLGIKWAAPEVTATNTLTFSNKTLTSPKFADLGFIADANGNELIVMDTTTSAVNEIKISNAATGGMPTISSQGSDTNVGLNLVSKGTGTVQVNSIQVADISLLEELEVLTIMGAIL
jgi:hypothetical protein